MIKSENCWKFIAEAGLLGGLSIRLAERVAPMLGQEISRPPCDPPPVEVVFHWHRRHKADAAQALIRVTVAEVMGSEGAG